MIVEIEKATRAVAESVAAVALCSSPGQVQELELCVGISCGGAGGTHLPMVLGDVAELVPHPKSGGINAASSSADPPRLSVVDFCHHLVRVHAHLVQLLRLTDQYVLCCLVQVHRLPQVLAFP